MAKKLRVSVLWSWPSYLNSRHSIRAKPRLYVYWRFYFRMQVANQISGIKPPDLLRLIPWCLHLNKYQYTFIFQKQYFCVWTETLIERILSHQVCTFKRYFEISLYPTPPPPKKKINRFLIYDDIQVSYNTKSRLHIHWSTCALSP